MLILVPNSSEFVALAEGLHLPNRNGYSPLLVELTRKEVDFLNLDKATLEIDQLVGESLLTW